MSDKYPAPEDKFPEDRSSGSGTDHAYSVQARLALYEPKVICGHILDLRWTTLHFDKSPIGVPNKDRMSGHCPHLLSFNAAQALRWWFLAQAQLTFDHLCVETRLVQHKIEYSWKETTIAAGNLIGERMGDHFAPAQKPDMQTTDKP